MKTENYKLQTAIGLVGIFVLIYTAATVINIETNKFSPELGVAIGTTLLAGVTALSILYSIYSNTRRSVRNLAQKRLDEFYSPLIKIFTTKPGSIMNNKKMVEERADEVISILLGKRYLATLKTINAIPTNIEYIVYFNWMNPKAIHPDPNFLDPVIGYLGFKDEKEKEPWHRFADQLQDDYDSLVRAFYSSEKSQPRPEWQFFVKS